MRSMAGGLMGGMLGSMLFSSFAGASGGLGGAGGIGLFEIALLAGIAYLIYRFMKKKREERVLAPVHHPHASVATRQPEAVRMQPVEAAYLPADSGLQHIQQMDRDFDETAFQDMVMNHFFRIQAAWMNRDLSSVSGLLTDEMRTIMQGDIDQLLKEKKINRLENIAVRKVEIAEAWQEAGQDYITALDLSVLKRTGPSSDPLAAIRGSCQASINADPHHKKAPRCRHRGATQTNTFHRHHLQWMLDRPRHPGRLSHRVSHRRVHLGVQDARHQLPIFCILGDHLGSSNQHPVVDPAGPGI